MIDSLKQAIKQLFGLSFLLNVLYRLKASGNYKMLL